MIKKWFKKFITTKTKRSFWEKMFHHTEKKLNDFRLQYERDQKVLDEINKQKGYKKYTGRFMFFTKKTYGTMSLKIANWKTRLLVSSVLSFFVFLLFSHLFQYVEATHKHIDINAVNSFNAVNEAVYYKEGYSEDDFKSLSILNAQCKKFPQSVCELALKMHNDTNKKNAVKITEERERLHNGLVALSTLSAFITFMLIFKVGIIRTIICLLTLSISEIIIFFVRFKKHSTFAKILMGFYLIFFTIYLFFILSFTM